jgi:hypothetical protein
MGLLPVSLGAYGEIAAYAAYLSMQPEVIAKGIPPFFDIFRSPGLEAVRIFKVVVAQCARFNFLNPLAIIYPS